jgi:hypothetical protein
MESARREAIMAAVSARVRSFEAAERAQDPEQLLAHYASGPDCLFYHDGRRANHDVIAAGIRKALPGVRSLEVVYSDVGVTVSTALEQSSITKVASHGFGVTSTAGGSSFTGTSLTRWSLRSRGRSRPTRS